MSLSERMCSLDGQIARPANVGLVLFNHANFYRFDEPFSYWSVKQISVFLCFSLVNQRHTSGITVYNRTAISIENTVRAVHSYNSWLFSERNTYAPVGLPRGANTLKRNKIATLFKWEIHGLWFKN